MDALKTLRLNSHLSDEEVSTLSSIIEKHIIECKNNITHAQNELDKMNNQTGRDEVDFANESMIRQSQTRFMTRESFYLKKLVKAKKLIQDEEYGICKDCGAEIGFARLRARPTSEMCLSCKEESEKEEKQNFHGRRSKSLGKELKVYSA